MNLKIILLVVVFLSFFVETTIITFPISYIALLTLYIIEPSLKTVIIAFMTGLLLDTLRLTPVGLSSVFILSSFVVVELVKRLVEFKDYKPILLLLLVGSFIYAKIFSYSDNLFIFLIVFASIGIVAFFLQSKFKW